jgi:hypothetical protein
MDFQMRNLLVPFVFTQSLDGVLHDAFSDLQAAATQLTTDVDATITEAQAASGALNAALDDANATIASLQAGDVVTAATIATLTASLAAATDGATSVTAALNTLDATVTNAASGIGIPALPPVVVVPPPAPVTERKAKK